MKIKTSELSGAALDWAVAMAEGRTIHDGDWYGPYAPEATLKVSRHRSGNIDALCHLGGGAYQPSSRWDCGGPIIEREHIATRQHSGGTWYAMLSRHLGDGERAQWDLYHWVSRDKSIQVRFTGPTPLIAAMRCFVASKLGDEVEVPGELLS